MVHITLQCIGQTKNLRQALTNGFTAAIVTIRKLLRGQVWLVLWSWLSYLRSIRLNVVHIMCMDRLIIYGKHLPMDVLKRLLWQGSQLAVSVCQLCFLGYRIYDLSFLINYVWTNISKISLTSLLCRFLRFICGKILNILENEIFDTMISF